MKSLLKKYSFPVGYAFWQMIPAETKRKMLASLLNPRALSPYIDKLPPPLKNRFLDLASLINDPFVATMGLKVLSWEDLKVEIRLPNSFQNRDASQRLHIGAISTLAEITSRLFWERHLDPKLSTMQAVSVQVEILNKDFSSLNSLFTCSLPEIEEKLFELRSKGELNCESEVQIFDEQKLIARASLGWIFKQKATLGAASSETKKES
jgi:hypothetical protein